MVEIEKGIPMPVVSRYQTRRGWAEIARRMEVGDSVLMTDLAEAKAPANVAKTRLANSTRPLGYKFSARRVEGGYRVWRVA